MLLGGRPKRWCWSTKEKATDSTRTRQPSMEQMWSVWSPTRGEEAVRRWRYLAISSAWQLGTCSGSSGGETNKREDVTFCHFGTSCSFFLFVRFKGTSGPNTLETSGKTMKLFFKSNKKKHGDGATCTVACVWTQVWLNKNFKSAIWIKLKAARQWSFSLSQTRRSMVMVLLAL